jgi:uncharacterized protein YbjT (DUF2867 family)
MSDLFVLVAGATGKQGGAVAKHLLAQGVKVRALTRDASSAAAEKLRQAGAEIAKGDLNDRTSLDRALAGVNAVFSVQDFWAKGIGYEGEVRQGVNLANAAQKAQVAHFVQSGMARATHIEGIEHFESKQAICSHIQSIGLPHTIVGTVYFMDNMLDLKRGGAMTFPTLSGTLKQTTKMHMLAVEDLGAIVAHLFAYRSRYLGQYVDIASDCLTVPEMKQIYQRVSGKRPKSWALPAWLLRIFSKDFAKQLAWQNDLGWSFSVAPSRVMHPALTSFEKYIRRHQIENL